MKLKIIPKGKKEREKLHKQKSNSSLSGMGSGSGVSDLYHQDKAWSRYLFRNRNYFPWRDVPDSANWIPRMGQIGLAFVIDIGDLEQDLDFDSVLSAVKKWLGLQL